MSSKMLTRKQVLDIRANLTMGDVRAAKAQAGDDQETLGYLALQRRAQKMNLANGDSLEDFLDTVRIDDITEAFSDEIRDPTSAVTKASLASAASGE